MCWDTARRFPRSDHAPEDARRFCARELSAVFTSRQALADTIGDISLVVSELVTNSLSGGAHIATVTLDWHRDRLRVTVGDDADVTPGTATVSASSSSWGLEELPGRKIRHQIWTEFDVLDRLATTLPCNR
jgi:hypothetical protein